MDFIISKNNSENNMYIIPSNHPLYDGRDPELLQTIFEHPSITLDKYLNYLKYSKFDPYINFDSINEIGGAKSKEINSKEKSKSSKKVTYLTVVPSFINVINRSIAYNNRTKMSLKEIKPKTTNVILGTILDMMKIKQILKKEIITKDDITTFVNMYNAIPLMGNFNANDIVYNNNKKKFFHANSKLIFVTFKIKQSNKYYAEMPAEEVDNELKSIDEIIKDRPYIVSHYIFNNYYFIVPNPKNNLTLFEIYNIDFDNKETPITKFEKDNGEKNNKKITLVEFTDITNTLVKKYVTVFDYK